MRERLVLGTLTLAAVLAVGSCKDDVGLTSVPEPPVEVQSFIANLNAAQEVPTNASTATATARFSAVGGVLLYTITITSAIANPVAAHIHGPAPSGQNTGVIVNLCGTGAPAPSCGSGATGVLASGVASPAVQTVSFDSLLVLLGNGQAYVNVHTNDGVAPTNTGPGDLASGEIRGQVAKQ